MRRPLFGIGLVFFLSTAAALVFGFNFSVAVGLFLLLCSGLSLLLLRRAQRKAVFCLLLTAAVAMGLAAWRQARYIRPVQSLDGRTVYLKGRVSEISYYEQQARYLLEARIPLKDGRVLKTNLQIYASSRLPTGLNEELRGYVSLQLPDAEGKYRWMNLSSGILLAGSFQEEPQLISKEQAERSPGYYVTALREYLMRQNKRMLAPDAAVLVNALLLGQKQELSEELLLDFRRAGIVHLMSVSGFHVSLVAALFMHALRFVGISRRKSGLLALPFILLFVALAGFTASAVRAGLMSALSLIAMAAGERYDPPSALGFAMLTECLCDPFSALSAGFLLSFGACMGILFAGPGLTSRMKAACSGIFRKESPTGKIWELLLDSFGISLAAFLFTLPVQIYLFDTFSLVAPLVSALATPIAALALWLAAVALLLSIFPFLFLPAKLISVLTAALVRLLAGLAALFSSLPFAMLPVHYEFLQWLVILFYLGALVLAFRHAERRTCRLCALLGAGVLAIGMLSAGLLYRGTVQLTVFPGMDAAVLISGKQAALIGFPQTAYQGRVIESYLRDQQVDKLQLALSTSLDNEKAAGTPALFRRYPPRQVVMPAEGRYTENILYALPLGQKVQNRARVEQLEILGVKLQLLPCSCGVGCEFDFGGAKLLKTNENCVIMKSDLQTQGIIRGWTLIKERRDGERMKAFEEAGMFTSYTFRIYQGGESE
ncbi:MAG: hypothetical protein HFG27_07295 [Provencibacterium sp.]|jgi:competence protein ComEC|nr:hypothetical protein [Provencibacterium sp.]